MAEIAVKMGLIPPDIKTAILVAQAAERTQRLAEKAEKASRLIADSQPVSQEGCVEPTDTVFRFVGSERDAPHVKYAQGMWMAAQMYYNDMVRSTGRAGKNDVEAVAGFKLAAAELYDMAGEIIEKAGQKEAAEKLKMVSHELGKSIERNVFPEETLTTILENLKKSGIENKPLEDAFKKVIGLITNHPSGPKRHHLKNTTESNNNRL